MTDLGEDVKSADIWAIHVVPEGQALLATTHRGTGQASNVVLLAIERGGLDVDVVAGTLRWNKTDILLAQNVMLTNIIMKYG